MYISTDKTYYNLLLKNYPQYESLRRELMKLIFRKAINKGERVDCYVNLNSYIRSIYSRVDYKYDEKLSITASIINFAAHLKEFFASRFSIYARIFLVYGNQRSQNAVKFVSEYDAHRELERKKDPLIEQIVVDDLSKCEEIVKYIPDVFMISNQDTEPGVIIREIIKSESSMGNKFPRLIFSKDLYDYQLVSSCPNTHLIRVKKTFNGDMTFTVSYFDFYKKLSSVLKLKYGIGEKISPELYSIYMTLSGCRDRNIRGFINYPRADKLIHGLLAKGLLFNGYNPSFGVFHGRYVASSYGPLWIVLKNDERFHETNEDDNSYDPNKFVLRKIARVSNFNLVLGSVLSRFCCFSPSFTLPVIVIVGRVGLMPGVNIDAINSL